MWIWRKCERGAAENMFYVPNPGGERPEDGERREENQFTVHPSGHTANQKKKSSGAVLTVNAVCGENLAIMDPNGKSDPYLVVSVDDQEERTAIQYNTLNPQWREILQFDLFNSPHLLQNEQGGTLSDVRLVHYITIDVWDKDTLNRDDFMGRVMIPLCLIYDRPLSGWFQLGRLTAKDNVSGRIYLEIALQFSQPVTRWHVDTEMYQLCKKRNGFELPVHHKGIIQDFPGEAEHVEMVLDDVVVEVCKHRGVGTVYLTNFRLIIICNTSSYASVGHNSDVSMWIPLSHLQSVDKGEDEKIVRRTESGNIVISDVKAMTIRCIDFRIIHLAFMESRQTSRTVLSSPQSELESRSSNDGIMPVTGEDVVLAMESFKRSTSLTCSQDESTVFSAAGPSNIPSTSAFTTQQSMEDTVTLHDDVTRCSSQASSDIRVLSRSSSTSSVVAVSSNSSDGLAPIVTQTGVSAGSSPPVGIQVLESGFTGTMQRMQNTAVEQQSHLPFYLTAFYQRLEYLILNAVDSPPSGFFVKYYRTKDSLYGWDHYQFMEEFARQKVSMNWRITQINENFSLCSSYPRHVYVPGVIDELTLESCASFRSKGRFPALCWFNTKRGNFIMRCAQPKSGTMFKYSVEDECVVQAARKCNPASNQFVIFDARSMFAAGGNRLKGKGTEDTWGRYQGCKLIFLDIPNIHAVRDSWDRLQVVTESSSQKKWLSHLESTNWLTFIGVILRGATMIARYVDEKGVGALVHCSDGWDRTSQLTSLAQLMLDAEYRTYQGFKILLEKEWLSFGHRFRDRVGHPLYPSQRSPVFMQFLDAVWQIMRQFPSVFEFTEDILLKVADHVSSGWFGTFLGNNVRERNREELNKTALSLWAHLDAVQDTFKNPGYSLVQEVILPVCSLRRLLLWSGYFLRYDETAWSVRDYSLDYDDSEQQFTGIRPHVDTVVWVPNERAHECHDCKQRFTQFKRKHHCRACGRIFCDDCSKQRLPLPQFGYTTPERVCDSCFDTHKIYVAEIEEDEEFEIINVPLL